MVSNRVRIPLLFTLFCGTCVLGWAEETSYPEHISLRRDEAHLLYRADNYHGALDVLEPVVSVNHQYSDLLYLQSVILESTGQTPAVWVPPVEKAVHADSWNRYNKMDGHFLLVKGYVITRRYSEALLLMDRYPEDVLVQPEYATLYALALSRVGRSGDADEFVAKATAVYPDAAFLHVLRMRWSAAYRETIAERVLKNGLFHDEPIILKEIILNPDTFPDEVRIQCIAILDEIGPAGRSVEIEKLGLSGIPDEDAVELILRNLPEDRGDLLRLSRVLSGTEHESKLKDTLSVFTGSISDDLNGDGIYDRNTAYADGQITSLSVDNDQDGLWEFTARFTNGIPDQVVMVRNGSEYTYLYAPYPYAGNIDIQSEEMTAELELDTGSIIFPFFSEIDTTVLPTVSLTLPEVPEIGRLLQLAKRVTREYRESGAPVIDEEDRVGDVRCVRTYRDNVLIRETTLRNNVVVRSLRDTDRDGRFDVEEKFTGGKSVELLYDEDGDGNIDYRYSISGGLEEWDFNDDGIVDCREVYSEGSIIREYSSELDGYFDVTLTIGDELIRNGVKVRLYRDTFGNYWIGSQPREDLLDNLTGSPLTVLEDMKLMSFSIRGIRYIEVLR